MCAVQALLRPLDYLRPPPTIQEGLPNGRPNLDCHTSLYFGSGLLGLSRAIFLVLVCHHARLLDLKMYWTSPAVSMLKTN